MKFTGLPRSAEQPGLAMGVSGTAGLDLALLPILALRFAGHLPYFKFGSQLVLPQGLSFAGAAVTALAYSALCIGLARGVTQGRLASPAAGALLGSLLLLAVMMVIGPLIGLLLPMPAETAALEMRWTGLLPPYLALLLPICAVFFAAQMFSNATSLRALKGERVRKG